jgi:DNA-binding MarR family transcriptional regulator
MSHLLAPASVVVAALILVIACEESLAQQRRSPFSTSRVSLSTLAPVQKVLALTDEQKELADSLHDELTEERNDIFQNSGGDFEAARVEYEEVTDELNAKFSDKLDDTQKARLTEVFVQANGPNALADPEVVERLKLTDEQKGKLEDIRQENRQAFFDSFQDFQGMSDEERRDAFTKLQEEGDARLLAGLTAEQRAEFEKLSGEEVDYDLSELRGAFGGGGGGGRRAGGGDSGAESDRPQRPQ